MVSAIGTHAELLETSEIYREVYLTQNKASHDERLKKASAAATTEGSTASREMAVMEEEILEGGELDG